jgi:hypothetical protein
MADVKFAVLFSAVDNLSDKLGAIGERLMEFGNRGNEAGERLGEMGERVVGFSERLGLDAAPLSEGADTVYEWSEAIQEPAQNMQKNMAIMAAMTGLAGDALEEVRRRAVDFPFSHPGATAEEWVAGFTRMRGIFQDTAQAMKAEDTVAMEGDVATRLIQVGRSNVGSSRAAATRDQLTRAIHLFGLAPEQKQFAMAVGWMGASAPAAHAPFSEVLALSGQASRLIGGDRGSQIFVSMIQGLETATATGKATIDFSQGLVAALRQLKSHSSGTSTDKLAELAEIGLGSRGPQFLKLLDNLDEVAAKQKQISDSSRALAKAYSTATDNEADATPRLQQNWGKLADTLSSPALRTQTHATNLLSDAVERLSKHLENHTRIIGVTTVALNGIGSVAYHGVQAMSARGTMSVFAGRGFQAAEHAMNLLDFEAMALRFMYAKEVIGGIVNATNLWAVAQWVLNAALSPTVLTIGGIVARAAALALAADEIYKHWDTVKGFFICRWDDVKGIFADAADWMKTASIKMVRAQSDGILSATEWPVKAAEGLAEKIGGYFKFHSPPAYGPLRNAILNIRLGEELAKHIAPASVIPPARALVAGIAATAALHPASAAAAPITINYTPVINGAASPDEWVKVARQHAKDLMRIIGSELNREARLAFV